MAKVVDFPMKKLPDDIEEYIRNAASEYVERINTVLTRIDAEVSYSDTDKVMELVMMAFVNGVIEAADKLGES